MATYFEKSADGNSVNEFSDVKTLIRTYNLTAMRAEILSLQNQVTNWDTSSAAQKQTVVDRIATLSDELQQFGQIGG